MFTSLLLALACAQRPPADTATPADADFDADGVPSSRDCDDADPAVGAPAWLPDLDGDGYGWGEGATCAGGPGRTLTPGDCDDTRAEVHPGAPETCDGVDEDCDGQLDEDAVDMQVFYRDADDDGVGVSVDTIEACTLPRGYSPVLGDCDGREPTVHAGADPICGDGLDNDCDGLGDCDMSLEGRAAPADAMLVIEGKRHLGLHSFVGQGDLTGDGLDDLVLGFDAQTEGPIAAVIKGPITDPEDALERAFFIYAPASDAPGDTTLLVADLDGDGSLDLALGRPSDQGDRALGTERDPGALHVVTGPIQGDVDLAEEGAGWTWWGLKKGEEFGAALAFGDIDGDGLGDLIVGAPGHDGSAREVGRVYKVPGPLPTVTSALRERDLIVVDCPGMGGDRMGEQVLVVPDLDADGVDDLVLPIPSYGTPSLPILGSGPSTSGVHGAVAILVNGLTASGDVTDLADLAIVDWNPYARAFGVAVSGVGDTDGDGYGELLVGAPGTSELGWEEGGAAWLLDGDQLLRISHPSPIEAAATTVFYGGAHTWQLGGAVASAGDLDGDGLSDLLIGVAGLNLDEGAVGGAALFLAPFDAAEDAMRSADWLLVGDTPDADLGRSVGAVGDLDGQGGPDVAVMARSEANPYGQLLIFRSDAM